MNKLISYFSNGITSQTLETVGAEIETQFVNKFGEAVSITESQTILKLLIKSGWTLVSEKSGIITGIADKSGNTFFYELGRHNIELATTTSAPENVIQISRNCLNQLYRAAEQVEAQPHFSSILESSEDLLVIPDERDAIWLELDGKQPLMMLARTSSVQFTFSVSPKKALPILNALGSYSEHFLEDFPQDRIWKEYIAQSQASYRQDRYGGPLHFTSIEHYCKELQKHDVVQGTSLTPHTRIAELDIPLFIRSVWWHFRLKRYGNALCIEVRPIGRQADEELDKQLQKILTIIQLT